MNLQIRIQVPKSDKPYASETDVDVITDPVVVRAVLKAIFEVEDQRPTTVTVNNINGESHEEPVQ